MAFIAYNPKTMRCIRTSTGYEVFATERTAKAALTRAVNAGEAVREDFVVGTIDQYDEADFDVEVISAFDGVTKVTIKKSVQGTVCDPSRDSYWSM